MEASVPRDRMNKPYLVLCSGPMRVEGPLKGDPDRFRELHRYTLLSRFSPASARLNRFVYHFSACPSCKVPLFQQVASILGLPCQLRTLLEPRTGVCAALGGLESSIYSIGTTIQASGSVARRIRSVDRLEEGLAGDL